MKELTIKLQAAHTCTDFYPPVNQSILALRHHVKAVSKETHLSQWRTPLGSRWAHFWPRSPLRGGPSDRDRGTECAIMKPKERESGEAERPTPSSSHISPPQKTGQSSCPLEEHKHSGLGKFSLDIPVLLKSRITSKTGPIKPCGDRRRAKQIETQCSMKTTAMLD